MVTRDAGYMRSFASSSSSSTTTSTTTSTSKGSWASAPVGVDERSVDDASRVHISVHKQQAMLDQINATVATVLQSMVSDGPSGEYWKPKGRKKGISYFVDANVTSSQYRFCCVSETTASVQDVLHLFVVADTPTLLKHCRIMYDCVLDARILNVISYPTPAAPFKSVYVRYTSFESPKLLDNRDMCLVVATNVFTHFDGSTIGYCLWDSVELPECPDRAKTHGLVRMRMFRSGFFLRATTHPNETTKIVYVVGSEAGGIAPRLATRLAIDKFTGILGRICGHFRRKHLDPTTFVHRSQWVSKLDTKHCQSCLHTFGALSVRTNCAACGGVVCKACYTKEKVDVPGAGLTRVHICSSCLETRGIDGPAMRSNHSSSPKASSTSLSTRWTISDVSSHSDASSISM